jgi:hypothetical protein
MPSTEYLQLEKMIARAHRAMFEAGVLADGLNQQQLAWELEAMCIELASMQEDLLKHRPRP